jgi:glycerol-3-phosphate dehydrogenase (NAD(P)+)
MLRIGVLGAGSYGTCLAKLLSDAGHEVTLWCRSPELAAAMTETRENGDYLPGYRLAPAVTITTDLGAAAAGTEVVVAVTPSHAARDVLTRALPHFDPEVIVVNASKGLEEGTLDRIDQLYASTLPARIASRAVYLSGPTFAKEIAAGLPAAIVIAGDDHETRTRVQSEIATDRFRVYTSDDVVGVLIGGALKNVVAIAAGLSDGLGFGLNSRAALITRGLAEIARIGVAQGAHPMTFQGLSGMGDLVLTCSGDLSRNRRVGLALGEGKKLDEIVADMKMVAEGVKTTRVARELARRLDISAPIIDFMYAVLYEDRPARSAIADLMKRSLKSERD